jgi:4,5-DOPA dioxygenase extradiol
MSELNAGLPTAFISHGAPTYALDGREAAAGLRAWVDALARPSAVLIVSAHWITRAPFVGVATSAAPRTIHDFGGFPAPLYALQYPAPGAPELARRVASMLTAAGWRAAEDDQWGLDHGAWVPLTHMFPAADVPVFQVSMPADLTPERAVELGRALGCLRSDGVLILGSGSLTHNLRHMQADGAPVLPYVAAFVAHVKQAALRNDRAALAKLAEAAPDLNSARSAHPSLDHLLPLFVAMGASGGESVDWLEGGIRSAALSMDSLVFH